MSRYAQAFDLAVTEAEDHLRETTRIHEINATPTTRPNPKDEALASAKKSLEAAKKRREAFQASDPDRVERLIDAHRAEARRIAEELGAELAPRLTALLAECLALEARKYGRLVDAYREWDAAAALERELTGTRSDQRARSMLESPLVDAADEAKRATLARLSELLEAPDDSELSRALKKQTTGGVSVGWTSVAGLIGRILFP